MKENAETRLEEAKTTKVKADTAILNADREREKAERKQREYQKLCDDQKAEIDKAAERKIEAYKKSVSQAYEKKERKLREQLKRKVIWYHFVLAELGIYGIVMTILYLS